eukprot:GEMP01073150.1.p1 GENE.GEMP01073150.1~~GEMP01073150.1.p1  ORF type:complete len:127 (-),score=10.49 GEMP01073150.1:432-812(-)
MWSLTRTAIKAKKNELNILSTLQHDPNSSHLPRHHETHTAINIISPRPPFFTREAATLFCVNRPSLVVAEKMCCGISGTSFRNIVVVDVLVDAKTLKGQIRNMNSHYVMCDTQKIIRRICENNTLK